ncbi:hypothetical protein PMAYCL1PPCAC_15260, partial [Pristionchus mayeri]
TASLMLALKFFLLSCFIELSLSFCYRWEESSIPRKVLSLTSRAVDKTCRAHCTPNVKCEATRLTLDSSGCFILGPESKPPGSCPAPFASWVKREANCCMDLIYLKSSDVPKRRVLDETIREEVV